MGQRQISRHIGHRYQDGTTSDDYQVTAAGIERVIFDTTWIIHVNANNADNHIRLGTRPYMLTPNGGGGTDVLVFGNRSPDIDDSQVNFSETANAGTAGVEEAFVIYRPTGQIVWALIRTRLPCVSMVWITIF